jgi:hypothetical protein
MSETDQQKDKKCVHQANERDYGEASGLGLDVSLVS